MTEPDKHADFSAALVAALGELSEVPKDQTATVKGDRANFTYSYADLGSVLTYVRPILAKHGLAIMQPVSSVDGNVVIRTEVLHISGERYHGDPLSMPRGQTPQQTGSAITYGRRYSLLSTLGLATADDDGAAASKAPAKQAEAPKPNTAARKRVFEIAGKNIGLATQWWEDGASNFGKGKDDELTPEEADAVIQHAEEMAEAAMKLSVEPARNRDAGTKARKAAKAGSFDLEHWEGKAEAEATPSELGLGLGETEVDE
jgi:hypothetical protein